MASTTLAVVIKKEPHESAAERFAAVPEAKRQRARSSTPHSGGKYAESCEGQLSARVPGRFSAVAPPPLSPLPLPSPLTPESAVYEDPVFHDAVAVPGTPPGARASLVPLAELSSIMEQFTYMLDANFAKLQAIIVPTAASAVAPLLGQVSDLTQRMDYLERRLNENTYTPPQTWSDQGWTDWQRRLRSRSAAGLRLEPRRRRLRHTRISSSTAHLGTARCLWSQGSQGILRRWWSEQRQR